MAAQEPQRSTQKGTHLPPAALAADRSEEVPRPGFIRLKEIIDNANKFVTTAAVIVGGVWTYKLFVEHREAYARANLKHDVTVIEIDDERRLIRLDVIIENTGNIILPLRSAEVRVESVLPFSERIQRSIDETMDQAVTQADFFPWPVIRVRHSEWEDGKFELEPGEHDDTHYEFIIPAEQEVINIYTHFDNAAKQDDQPGIGWDHATLVDLRRLQERRDMR